MCVLRGEYVLILSLLLTNICGSNLFWIEEPFGEGAAISFTDCNRSFDSQFSCSVNDMTFIYNTFAKKGRAVSVSSSSSYIESHRCVVDNTTTGWPFEDDRQGEGSAFSLESGITVVMEDCVLKNNYCGRKVGNLRIRLSGVIVHDNNCGLFMSVLTKREGVYSESCMS